MELTREYIEEYYNTRSNYKIVKNNTIKNNLCVIYFSSNGIYDPHTVESFNKTIVEKDRFEWYSNRIEKANTHIFVRDLFKQWYIEGINTSVSSIDKLIVFLKELTEGFDVITVGSSAGGYASVLFGILLNAKCIYSFSGQFNLDYLLDKNYPNQYNCIARNKDNPNVSKYINITNIIKGSQIPIVYFYPALCKEDIYQYNQINDFDNFIVLPINSFVHGVTIYSFNMKTTLNLNIEELKRIKNKFKNKSNISQKEYSIKTIGLFKTLCCLVKNKINHR